MTDIVSKLRSMAAGSDACLDFEFSDLIFKAADEIERLRNCLEHIRTKEFTILWHTVVL